MNWNPWQIIILVAVVFVGAQLPMYALASSIDNDEYAKTMLGALITAVFVGGLGSVLKILTTKKGKDV